MARRLLATLLGPILFCGLIFNSGGLSFAAPALAPSSGDLNELTATEAVNLLCSRSVTAEAYVSAIFETLDDGYSCLNAFQTIEREQVMEDARAIDAKAAAGGDVRPLCGLPLAVKDSIDVEGYPTSAGTPALLDAMMTTSAPLVDSYKAANGIILGKTVLAELSSSGTSINPTTARLTTPLNPYNNTRHTGGSSGGSAVAVASGLAPLALCEDTGGSCRMPASANGIFGFRPTLGCYNYTSGLVPATFTRDTVGSMARTMDDLILLDGVVRLSNFSSDVYGMLEEPVSCATNVNKNFNLTGVRLGLPSTFGWQSPGLSEETQAVTNRTLTLLEDAGVELIPFDSSVLDITANTTFFNGFSGALAFEEPDTLARYLWSHESTMNISVGEVYSQINRPDLRPTDLAYLNISLSSTAGNISNWVDFLANGRPRMHKVWETTMNSFDLDAMLYPVFATSPRPIDATEPYIALANGTVISFFNSIFTLEDAQIAQAALSIPIGMSTDGLPAALQLGVLPGSDEKLLGLALAIEKLVGKLQSPPAPQCNGCQANVQYAPASYNGTGAPASNDTWSIFSLTFNGNCESNFLTNYGKSGPLGSGTVTGAMLGTVDMPNMGIVASN